MTWRWLTLFLALTTTVDGQTALERFAVAETKGDVSAMRREADAATVEDAKNPSAWRALARTLEAQAVADIARGKYAFVSVLRLDACDTWVKAASLARDPKDDLLQAANAALLAGDGARGLAALNVLVSNPSPDVALLAAKLHLLRGDAAAAARLLKPLANDPMAWGPLAETAVLLGDRELAETLMVESCQKADGLHIAAVFGPLTRSWRDHGDPNWSSLVNRVARRVPSSPFMAWYVGDAAYRNSRAYEAVVGFLAYATAFPEDSLGWQCLALAYPLTGQFAAADDALTRAIELGSSFEAILDARRRMVAAAYNAKNYALACTIQAQVVDDSEDPSDRLDLGVLCLDVRDVVGAEAAYQHVAHAEDVSKTLRGKAWNYLALLLDGEGDKAASETALRKSIEVSDDADARENLANLLIDTERYAEAIPILERILRDEPTRTRSIYHLARARHPRIVLPPKK